MSQRTLDGDLEAGSISGVFGYVVFVELDFPSGILYVHNGLGTYNWGGNDWLGVGAFGKIDTITEGRNSVPNPIDVSLSSITEEIISAIRSDDVYGRAAKIYLGALDSDLRLKGTPTQWVDGYMEKKQLLLGKTDGASITIQDDAARIQLRNNKRYTLETHQNEFSGDLFFEFLPYVMNAEVLWAGEKVRSGFRNEQGFTGDDENSIRRRARQDRR